MALAASVGVLLLLAPSTRAVVLYDQTGTPATAIISQDYEAVIDAFDTTAADDFTVPPDESWTIDRVDVTGIYSLGGGPAPSSRVRVYRASGTLPGATVFTSISLPADGGANPDFALPISGAPVLPPGHYWVSVQAIMDAAVGDWFWTTRAEQSGDPAVVENPGEGRFTGCTTFTELADCIASPAGPDLVFRLNGSIGPPPADGLPSNDFSFRVKKNKKKGTAKAKVKVPGPGDIELAKNKKVKGKQKSAEEAGTVKVPIKPKGKAKKKLNKKGKAKAKAEITYIPAGGELSTKSKKVKLIKR